MWGGRLTGFFVGIGGLSIEYGDLSIEYAELTEGLSVCFLFYFLIVRESRHNATAMVTHTEKIA